jgi:osmotically-inducible protein OsmY
MSELTLLRDVWDSLTRGEPLNVERVGVFASEGTVTLTGRVKNQWDENLAVALTRNTRGVHHVDNQLRIPIRLKRARVL